MCTKDERNKEGWILERRRRKGTRKDGYEREEGGKVKARMDSRKEKKEMNKEEWILER